MRATILTVTCLLFSSGFAAEKNDEPVVTKVDDFRIFRKGDKRGDPVTIAAAGDDSITLECKATAVDARVTGVVFEIQRGGKTIATVNGKREGETDFYEAALPKLDDAGQINFSVSVKAERNAVKPPKPPNDEF